ncbi:MAG TPA: molybdopterin-dependent oxidoreductase [Stellaceae bacterium]
MLNRRQILRGAGGGALLAGTGTLAGLLPPRLAGAATGGLDLPAALPEGTREEAVLEALPGKAPLIKLSYRPPNYETPVSYFDRSVFTPNEAFFVRYHLADIPEVDAKAWTLKIGGAAATAPLELTLDRLKQEFEPVEVAAVCMCSGNRRGLFQPHVPGVQWGNGAIGNARWKGARLRDILNKAGVGKGAVEVALNAADGPVLDKTPDFAKSLPVWKALDETVIVAYEMNGAPLPHWNGFPARLIVPGWTATYWVKHLTAIDALDRPFDGFWMKSAYRIPQGKFPIVQRFTSQEYDAATTPITEMVVNSMITAPSTGAAKLPAGQPAEVRGVAWDGGYGIRTVEVSADGGKSWKDAALGQDSGRFSFRPWSFRFTPKAGRYEVIARATNRIGQTQTAELILNPAGYHNNVMPRVTVTVA